METVDQEKIYKLYLERGFRDMETMQQGNLEYRQHPNNNLSTDIWRGMNDPASGHPSYTPRSENEEHLSLKAKHRATGDIFDILKVDEDFYHLRSREGKFIKTSFNKFDSFFEEI